MTTNRLPGATRLLIAGDAVNALGNGLVLPLTLIYLHQVRGIALPVVGALLALSAGVGLIAVPLAGVLLDRVGARPVLATVLTGQAVAYTGLAWAHSVATALPVLLVLGASMAPFFPAFTMLLASINPQPHLQQRAFALNFTVLNAGVGVGAPSVPLWPTCTIQARSRCCSWPMRCAVWSSPRCCSACRTPGRRTGRTGRARRGPATGTCWPIVGCEQS